MRLGRRGKDVPPDDPSIPEVDLFSLPRHQSVRVSRRHAVLYHSPRRGWFINVLGRNGVLLSNPGEEDQMLPRGTEEVRVRNGARIGIAEAVMTFDCVVKS